MTSFNQSCEKCILILAISSVLLVLIYDRSYSFRTKIVKIDWNNVDLHSIKTSAQFLDYFSWSDPQSCKLPHQVGNNHSSALSVCLLPSKIPKSSCLVYSFYVVNDWSFENAMKAYGCDVFAFNPSTNEQDHPNRTDSIVWIEGVKLGKENASDGLNGRRTRSRTSTVSFESIQRLLEPQHGKDRIVDYLKLDVEGDEWDAISELIESGSLTRIRQLGIQIHLPVDEVDDGDSDIILGRYRLAAGKIRTLESSHEMIRFQSKEMDCNHHSIGIVESSNNKTAFKCFAMAWYNVALI